MLDLFSPPIFDSLLDCSLQRDGRTILIRPGSTWVDPSDRCQRFDCSQVWEFLTTTLLWDIVYIVILFWFI